MIDPRPRLLVVDDEPSICRALALLFTQHELDVVVARSSAEALARLADSAIDCLLIDLRLRADDGDGDALFGRIVERHPALRTRTLFMTGDISAEAERAIAATECPYLLKPFDATVAVQAILALAGVTLPRRVTPADRAERPSAGGLAESA